MTNGGQVTPHKWAVLVAIGMSYFMTVVTFSFSVLALRDIAEDFDVTLRTVGWVVIIESLIVAALLLPVGGLSDRVGKHRTLQAGLGVFGVGLVLTGLSPTFITLIVARIVTALGNTLVQSVSTGILVGAFPPEERGLALGGQTTAVATGAAVGPLLGGLLLDALDWKLLFILLALPTALTFLVVRRVLQIETERPQRTVGFDTRGALLASSFITILIFTLNDPFDFGIRSPLTIIGGVLAIALLTAFVRCELRAERPMLDVRLFQIDDFRRAVALRVLGFIASSAPPLLIPILLLSVLDQSTRTTGAILALFAVGMTFGAQASGRLYDRLGPRLPMTLGITVQISVLLLLSQVNEESSLTLVAIGSLGNGLGQGLWNVPANSVMMGAMPADSLGVGGAFTNVTRTIGSVVGQAGATAVVAAVMVSQGFDIPLGDVADTTGAGAAFVDGWRLTFLIGAIVSALALLLAVTSSQTRRSVGASA